MVETRTLFQVAPEAEQAPKTNQYTQAEHGKTEMSLLHFTLTNPGWKPTGENERYLAGVKEAKGRDLAEIQLQVRLIFMETDFYNLFFCRRCPVKPVRCRQAFKAWKPLEGATEALPRVCSTASPLPLLPLYHHLHLLQSSGEDLPGWQALVWPGRKQE